MIQIEKDKKYLVTGGSGFLGNKLIDRILSQGGKIVTIARDEGKLIQLHQKYPEIEFFTGDISDRFEVKQCMKGVDGVFHLAAFKHVGIAELQSRECVKSNVIGSLNILEVGVEENVDFMVGISTDKAAIVSGAYGASKFLMEYMWHQFDRVYEDITFRTVRYGNVLYSTGSVLCKWKDLLEEGKEIVITEPKATRFFWTIDQAVDLIFDCMENAVDSKPYVPDMKAMEMGDLLQAMANKYLPSGCELKIKEIGLQPGENLHEKIFSDGLSSKDAERFSTDEIIELI